MDFTTCLVAVCRVERACQPGSEPTSLSAHLPMLLYHSHERRNRKNPVKMTNISDEKAVGRLVWPQILCALRYFCHNKDISSCNRTGPSHVNFEIEKALQFVILCDSCNFVKKTAHSISKSPKKAKKNEINCVPSYN